MPLDQTPTPQRIVGELLVTHPEAASLLAEASHCQALADHSAASAGQEYKAAQSARLGYEELRHRLDPRRLRPVHLPAALLILTVLSAGLAVLNGILLTGILPRWMAIALSAAAMSAWVTGAWLAVLARRDGRSEFRAVTVAGAIILSGLLAAFHYLAALPRWPMAWDDAGTSVLVAVLIDALAAGAAALMARTEPASLCSARRRFRRARTAHQAAVRLAAADTEAAAIAREAWLGLVRAQGSAAGDNGSVKVTRESVALASALQEVGRTHLDPP